MSDESHNPRAGSAPAPRRQALTAALGMLLLAAALVVIGSRGAPDAGTTVHAAGAASSEPPPAQPVDVVVDEIPTADSRVAHRSAVPDEEAPAADPDRRITVALEQPTQMIGISWTGSPGATIGWRALVDDAWTEREEAEDLPDEAPDDSARSGIGPVYLDGSGATALEIDLPDEPLDDLRIQGFRWDPDEVEPSADDPDGADDAPDLARQPMAAPMAGATPRPAIHPRSSWINGGWIHGNEDCASGPIPVDRIRHAVVHHSASGNTYSRAEVPAVMSSIHLFHTSGRGWCDFGYNYAVDRFGGIWEGRTTVARGDVVGGHASGFNNESVGIVVLGQHQPGESPAVARPSAASLDALEAFLAWKLDAAGIDPTSTVSVTSGGGTSRWPKGQSVRLPAVSGHRDVAYTSCPGEHLYTKLPSVRTGAAARIVTEPPTTTTPPTTVPSGADGWWAPFPDLASFTDRQAVDFLGRRADATDRAAVAREFERTGGTAAPILWFATRGRAVDTIDPAIRMELAWSAEPPTAADLTSLRDELRGGEPLDTVLGRFLTDRGADDLDDGAFVERIHRNVTGEPIDGATRAELLGRLAGGTPRSTILGEYLADPAFLSATDELVRIVAIHHSMLDTVPPVETLDDLVTETAPAVAARILTSPEYLDRIGANP